MEILCGSTSDMLRILPALPGAWPAGEFSDMLTRTGARVSARWNMEEKTIDLVLNAERDAAFDLKFSDDVAKLTCSQPEALAASKYGSRYRSVKLAEGDEIKLNIRLK